MKERIDPTDLQHIYRQLKLGLGHELVTDANVFELMALARRDGNQMLATELREWQAPCSDSNDGPRPTMPPTRGFNKDNAKH